MSNNASLGRVKWECAYHIAWIPKHWRKVLCEEVGEEIRDVLRKLVAAKHGG